MSRPPSNDLAKAKKTLERYRSAYRMLARQAQLDEGTDLGRQYWARANRMMECVVQAQERVTALQNAGMALLWGKS